MQENAGEVRTNSESTFSNGQACSHMHVHVLADQPELIYKRFVRTLVVVMKTCQKIEINGERERGREIDR